VSIVYRILFSSALLVAAFNLRAQTPAGMAMIPEGNYLPLYAGNNRTSVAPFYIDKHPVTNGEFLKFLESEPGWKKSAVKRLFADEGYLKHWVSDGMYRSAEKNSPVVNISWFAAKKYCECQGKRLPTTAEWERVAEAGWTVADGSREPGFNEWILAMASKPAPRSLPAVGTTKANYYGVWDMHGLVWEWTLDFNSIMSTGESRAATGSGDGLFCAGGSATSGDVSNYAAFLRYALRSSLKAGHVLQNLGFRCAADKK